MNSPLRTSKIRFVPASEGDQQRGLLAYVCVVLGPYKIDGIAVRRTLKGKLAISYPTRNARSGTAHPVFLPTDPDVRGALEEEIIAAYLQHEEDRG